MYQTTYTSENVGGIERHWAEKKKSETGEHKLQELTHEVLGQATLIYGYKKQKSLFSGGEGSLGGIWGISEGDGNVQYFYGLHGCLHLSNPIKLYT